MITILMIITLNNTVAKGFNQMAPPVRIITVALDMSKAFDTINIHTLIRKLLQTNIPGTIIKFIANYIKGLKTYTTYRNHTSKQCQFKTGVPRGDILSPTLFNIYTSDLPPPSAPVQRRQRTTLSQLRSGHCKLLNSYKKRLKQSDSSRCPDCGMDPQDVPHLFDCVAHPNDLSPVNLWDKPIETIRELSFLDPGNLN